MRFIKEHLDIDVEGVEINPHIVQQVKKEFVCYTVNEFQTNPKKYDVIIFSHNYRAFPTGSIQAFFRILFNIPKNGRLCDYGDSYSMERILLGFRSYKNVSSNWDSYGLWRA